MELELTTCPRCGAAIATEDAPEGLCPSCLLQLGLESDPSQRKGSGRMEEWKRSGVPTIEALAPLFPDLEILGMIGEGGMGIVYKARQRKLDRLVALKILRQDIASDPAFAERFMREARALARLSHPDIVSVHDFGQIDGVYYFVMEYVDGTNLRTLLERGEMSEDQTLSIMPRLCSALQFAHDRGVVHRDIKPENILIAEDGRVKIADFSLAKLSGSTRHEVLTGSNQAMGTANYMAPEQWKNPLSVDHRADLYSLGVVFYEMLTGDLPMGRFASPSQRAGVDVRIDEVVLRALEREPDERYQQASELQTDLEAIRPDLSVASSPPIRASSGHRGKNDHQTNVSGWTVLTAAFGALMSSFAPWVRLEADHWDEVQGMRLGPGIASSILFLVALTIALGSHWIRPVPLWRSFSLVAIGFTIFIVVLAFGSGDWVHVMDRGMLEVSRREAGIFLTAFTAMAILAWGGFELGHSISRRPPSTVSRIVKPRKDRSIVDRTLGFAILSMSGIGAGLIAAPWGRSLESFEGYASWLGVSIAGCFLAVFLVRLATRHMPSPTWRPWVTGTFSLVALGLTLFFLQSRSVLAFPTEYTYLVKHRNMDGALASLGIGALVLVASTLELSRSLGQRGASAAVEPAREPEL